MVGREYIVPDNFDFFFFADKVEILHNVWQHHSNNLTQQNNKGVTLSFPLLLVVV